MLKVSGMSVEYGSTRVIDKLDLALGVDEILMLVGPTGCGKTTILQALAGLVPIAEGTIELGAIKATRDNPVPPEKRNVGMVFQDFALFPHLTVEQNVTFRLSDYSQADHWLDVLGMSDFRRAKPETLSGGQKQRVALARTLAHQPAFVLLDEPLSNLDAALKESLRWEIRRALKSAGVPAIWVTHDQNEALSIGDRLGILDQGKLVQLASPDICFCQPATRFVARFLGEASFIPGTPANGVASTILGAIPVTEMPGDGAEIDVLLRPDDLGIERAENGGIGTITQARYEGETWLYDVELGSGELLMVRTSHENSMEVGTQVDVAVITRSPLAGFPRS